MSEEDALAAARKRFGGVAQIQERARDTRTWIGFEQLMQDFRYALRQLRRNPGFTTTIVITLALGIAACTSIFSIVDGLLFRPLPVRDPTSLVAVKFLRDNGWPAGPVSSPYYKEVKSQGHSFVELTAYASISVRLRAGDTVTKNAVGQMVPDDYFEVLGIRPILGRTFVPDDDDGSRAGPVAVISHACWQERFSADPGVLGQTIQLNEQIVTVVGVLPPGFTGLDSRRKPLYWVPDALEREIGAYTLYEMVGRLAPEVAPLQANAELDTIVQGLTAAHGGRPPLGYERYGFVQPQYRARLQPAAIGSWPAGNTLERDGMNRVAMLFGGAVGLVLIVACSNAASLMLVRALRRHREIAVRMALGATRGRLVRQLLIESLLVSLLAASVGMVLAHWGTDGLLALRGGTFSHIPIEPRMDGRVLAFATGLATLTGVVFGLLPSLKVLRFDAHGALKQEGAAVTPRFRSLTPRNLLIMAQVTVSLVLLLGAGLCLRSFANLLAVDPGFDFENVLAIGFDEDVGERSPQSGAERTRQLIERVSELRGVQAVSACDQMLPLSGNFTIMGFNELEGYARKPGEEIHVGARTVGPGYFRLLGIPVLQGREFDQRDLGSKSEVALVNQSFVRRYWPDQNPLGKRLRGAEVIGVVSDVRGSYLWEGAEPQVFSMLHQGPAGLMTLLVRTESDPAQLTPVLRHVLAAFDSSLEIRVVETLESIWSASLAGHRLSMIVLVIFSAIALVLVVVGLYGFVAYAVAQRTREIGIRVAIGAQSADIISLVMRQSLVIVVLGLGAGVLIALAATRLLNALLYGVTPSDMTTFVCVSFLLAAITLAACWFPARRAAKIDPVVALRAE